MNQPSVYSLHLIGFRMWLLMLLIKIYLSLLAGAIVSSGIMMTYQLITAKLGGSIINTPSSIVETDDSQKLVTETKTGYESTNSDVPVHDAPHEPLTYRPHGKL